MGSDFTLTIEWFYACLNVAVVTCALPEAVALDLCGFLISVLGEARCAA